MSPVDVTDLALWHYAPHLIHYQYPGSLEEDHLYTGYPAGDHKECQGDPGKGSRL